MPLIQVASDLATRSQMAKKLFPIYHMFTERFGMPGPPVTDARMLKPSSDPALIDATERWMDELDHKLDAFQLRSAVQSSNVGASELRILALLERLLAKPSSDSGDREKIDFLLAQLLATQLSLHGEHTPSLAEVAEVLEPVVGKVNTADIIPGLESLISELHSVHRLIEIKQKSIIERGREVKNGFGNKALLPENLVACSRFNFLLRRRCLELMKDEVKLINVALNQLLDKGFTTLDCSMAKMSAAETISDLLEMCRHWQNRENSDYAYDNPFSQVLALQEIVGKAVAKLTQTTPATSPISPVASVKHAEEPQKPTPDVIQIYAELAALRREHHQLAERVHQKDAELIELRQTSLSLREQFAQTIEDNETLRSTLNQLQHEIKSTQQHGIEPTTPVAPAAPATVEEVAAPAPAEIPKGPVIAAEPMLATVAPSMQEIFQSLARRMEQIRETLAAEKINVRKETPSHLKLNHVSIVLTASETQSFLSPCSQADELICRGVAARFLLLEATRDFDKDTSETAVGAILAVCEAGASQLQEQAAHLPTEQAERVMETARLLTKTLKGFNHK
jgi:hypothetical protein